MDSDNKYLVILCFLQFGTIFFAIAAATLHLRFYEINAQQNIAIFLSQQGWILLVIPLSMAITVPYLRTVLWLPDKICPCILLVGLLFIIILFMVSLRLLLTPIWPHGGII